MTKAQKNKLKLNEWVSVKEFGAKGDGVTDDTAAFTAAVAASKFVKMPAGTYVLNNFRPVTNLHLKGDGYESTIIKQAINTAPAIRCLADASTGFLNSMNMSGFKVLGSTLPTVAAVIVEAYGAYAIWKSRFDFVAINTFRALEIQSAVANNVFRCDFKVSSEGTTGIAVLVAGGTYNTFDLFLTNCWLGKSLEFEGLGCTFIKSVTDGQQFFKGSQTVANNVTVEEWPGTALVTEAAIKCQGFTETFINPMVILSTAAAAKVGFAFRPFDNTVYVNPKVLAPLLNNPFQADNAFKFTIIGPGQSTTVNKMNTIFTDGGGNTNLTLRRVSFIGDCSQWVTANRPSGGAAIQYVAPLTGVTVEHLSNTDILIIEPAGTIAALTIQVPLAVDGQCTIVQATQIITTITNSAVYAAGADITAWPTTIGVNVPVRLVYRAANNKWYRR